MQDSDIELHSIRKYVEIEASNENILHIEKLRHEYSRGEKITAWEVRTDANNWIVFDNTLTNLYKLSYFPGLDSAFSYHIGLCLRLLERQSDQTPVGIRSRFLVVMERSDDVIAALEQAVETEDFQAVGMKLREVLLELVKQFRLANDEIKKGDFVAWSVYAADHFAGGDSNEHIRGWLKEISKRTWQLVNWLTHYNKANHDIAEMSLLATTSLIHAWLMAVARHEAGAPDKCPKCSSFDLISNYHHGQEPEGRYITHCRRCSWASENV